MSDHRFTHIAVGVADLDQAVRFYCEGLGFEPSLKENSLKETPPNPKTGAPGMPAIRIRFVRKDGIQLELVSHHGLAKQGASGEHQAIRIGLMHLAIKVPDVIGMAKTLESYGAVIDWGSRRDVRIGEGKTATLLFLTDPDGTPIELNNAPTLKRFPD